MYVLATHYELTVNVWKFILQLKKNHKHSHMVISINYIKCKIFTPKMFRKW